MTNANTGKIWSPEDITKLKKLANQNTPTGLISLKLERSKEAVFSKASQLGINLKPTNQSPYGPRKKN